MWRIYIKKTHSHTQIQKQTNKAKQKKRSYKSICTRAVTTQSSSAHDCQGRSQKIKGTVSRLCARASVICLFFKRQQNCHIDSTRFPSGPHRRRRFVVYILKQYFRLSKKSFVLFKIWLAARRLIAILSLAAPPRDPNISFRPL